MNDNKISKTTLTYCGKKFYAHAYRKNDVYKVFFTNDQFLFFEFYTNGYETVPLFLEECKNGQLLEVSWKRCEKTNKRIIVSVADAAA